MCKKFLLRMEKQEYNSLDQHNFFDGRANAVVIVRIGQIMNSTILY